MSTVLDIRLKVSTRDTGTAWVGTVPYLLSVLLAADLIAAAGLSLLFRDVLRGPEVSIGSLQGTALVLLVVALPVLVGAMFAATRGSGIAVSVWLGALAFVAYQGVLFLFATPFNPFFFFYLGMLSLATWAILALVAEVDLDRLAGALLRRFDVGHVLGCPERGGSLT